MFVCVHLGLAFLLPTVHVLFFLKDRSPGSIGRTYLHYLLPIAIGLGGLIAFMGHAFRADEVARSIGWQPGSPFQFEVAVANLAFAVLGILCLRFRDGFWLATILGYGVFLEGAAYGHVQEIVQAGNWATNNAGVVLLVDIVLPPLLLGMFVLSRRGLKPGRGRVTRP